MPLGKRHCLKVWYAQCPSTSRFPSGPCHLKVFLFFCLCFFSGVPPAVWKRGHLRREVAWERTVVVESWGRKVKKTTSYLNPKRSSRQGKRDARVRDDIQVHRDGGKVQFQFQMVKLSGFSNLSQEKRLS